MGFGGHLLSWMSAWVMLLHVYSSRLLVQPSSKLMDRIDGIIMFLYKQGIFTREYIYIHMALILPMITK